MLQLERSSCRKDNELNMNATVLQRICSRLKFCYGKVDGQLNCFCESQRGEIYYIQGNFCPRFIFTLFALGFEGEFKMG